MNEEAIFIRAIETRSETECRAYLDQACAGNSELRARVERLLEAHHRPDPFLEASSERLVVAVRAEEADGFLGQSIGPYKLLEKIGEGGMGLVFMAEQQSPVKRRVALKVIKPGLDTRQVIARFEGERQALAMMDHPNIARIFDMGATERGYPYFVMELVRGLPITAYCDQARLKPRERLELFVTVCQAVQHAHQKSIVHRDLKPANILVTMLDDKAIPKIIDFGVAKALGEPLVDRTMFTNFLQMIGTPLYMSPEQAQLSSLDVDTRSDVYSLGVLLYELLTGTVPFERERLRRANYDELRRIIRDEEPPRPSARIATLEAASLITVAENRAVDRRTYGPALRGDLDWIVMKALEKDRARRYESAGALASDIRRYLTDEPVEARPPSAAYRMKKFARRNITVLTATAVMLGVIIAVCVVAASITYHHMRMAQILAQEKTELALSEKQQRIESNRQLAYTFFDQSYAHCSADDAATGLLWLTRSLQRVHALGIDELDRPIRRQIIGWLGYVPPLSMSLSHPKAVTNAAFSPDGKGIMTVCADRCVRVWDVETERLRCPLIEHPSTINVAIFSPGGEWIGTGGADGIVRLWDAATGRPIDATLKHDGEIRALAFSQDGKCLVTASDDRTSRIWNVETPELIGQPLRHQSPVTCVGFSPDGMMIVTGCADGSAHLWDVATGDQRNLSIRRSKPLSVVKFSPNGKLVLTASLDRTASCCLVETGEVQCGPVFHFDTIGVADFSPDGKLFVTGSNDKTARIWETKTGQPIGQALNHDAPVTAVHFNSDGTVLLTASMDWKARQWDVASTQQLASALNCHSSIVSAMYSHDGKTILTGDSAGFARIWDVSSARSRRNVTPAPEYMENSSISPLGDVVFSAGALRARFWDAKTLLPLGEAIDYRRGPGDVVRSATFSPDGKLIAAICFDGSVSLWSAVTMEMLGYWTAHEGSTYGVAFHPDGMSIITGGHDRCARFWDVKTHQQLGDPFEHPNIVSAVAISPDGTTLITACSDFYVRRWDLASRRLMEPHLRHDGEVPVVGFSSDGSTILTGSYDHTARLWDAQSGLPIGPPFSHGDLAVEAIQIDIGEEILLTATGAKEAVLWDLAVRKPIQMPRIFSVSPQSIRLTPDGKRILVREGKESLRSFNVPKPIRGDVDQVMSWATVVTGMELDEIDAVRILSGDTWSGRRRKLRMQKFAP